MRLHVVSSIPAKVGCHAPALRFLPLSAELYNSMQGKKFSGNTGRGVRPAKHAPKQAAQVQPHLTSSPPAAVTPSPEATACHNSHLPCLAHLPCSSSSFTCFPPSPKIHKSNERFLIESCWMEYKYCNIRTVCFSLLTLGFQLSLEQCVLDLLLKSV